jgi:hypothetical protein
LFGHAGGHNLSDVVDAVAQGPDAFKAEKPETASFAVDAV